MKVIQLHYFTPRHIKLSLNKCTVMSLERTLGADKVTMTRVLMMGVKIGLVKVRRRSMIGGNL